MSDASVPLHIPLMLPAPVEWYRRIFGSSGTHRCLARPFIHVLGDHDWLTWRGAGMAHDAVASCAGYLGQPLRVLVLALAAAPA